MKQLLPKPINQIYTRYANRKPDSAMSTNANADSSAIRLRVENVSHRFGRQKVIEDIDFSLFAGQSIVVLGPSGSGKTTLFQICSGLIDPHKGKVLRNYKNLGYMFQTPRLLPWQTAYENLNIVLKARRIPKNEADQRIIEIACKIGLTEDDLDKYPYQLSGGMQSRVSMGRALIIRPDVLILDEPFTGLDIGLKHELMQILKGQISKGTSILMISHELADAVELAHTIFLIGSDKTTEPATIKLRHNITTDIEDRNSAVILNEYDRLIHQKAMTDIFNNIHQRSVSMNRLCSLQNEND